MKSAIDRLRAFCYRSLNVKNLFILMRLQCNAVVHPKGRLCKSQVFGRISLHEIN